ncbi:class I SAM-dependent methyltransferase [Devosia psychrophila]|uniref:Ubiquinone/menaquinone biosynthesis C-methylase UbiE n=1 Tax=Devosia psychrophila TaxID=728005 RepID=A0A1I1RLZ6_9HYPH|nr:class I SAM-dependent methyltransferase [Devosia psychrophila]SFD35037.1 Ubiquinone/menaquinone biosynthesis C-methylase UbiE [Devosia psychrophila]
MQNEQSLEMFVGAPPEWALHRPKPTLQSIYDFIGAPLRMVVLPDHVSERWHLTSLRAERLGVVLKAIEGKCLDVGAGDNMLVKLHRENSRDTCQSDKAMASEGVDVVDWGGGCTIVPGCTSLPYEDGTFDTVTFIACLNHIPERRQALAEALRVLRPGGLLIITMIGYIIGTVGHAIWWYSEDKHRDIADGEVMGMRPSDVDSLIENAGFVDIDVTKFVYGLNRMWLARRPV